jgi:hypothetical protein
MDDENSNHKIIEAGITTLAQTCNSWANSVWRQSEGDDYPDKYSDREKLIFLSTMSHYIASTLSKQNECKEIAHIWQELTMALSDVADGKSAKLFRPLKKEGAQSRRISVHRETYFSIAVAVLDRAERNEKADVLKRLSRSLNVKSSELTNFRKNLTRSDPNIKSMDALNIYDGVFLGYICFNENGHLWYGPGTPSTVADWLKWFENLTITEV